MEEELKSMFDEITKKIAEEEDNAIAKAFAIYSADLLRRNGIVPIMTKVELPYEECSETNKYQIALRYGYVFERLDTSEHDKQIIADERERIVKELEKKLNEKKYQHEGEDYYIGISEAIEIVRGEE